MDDSKKRRYQLIGLSLCLVLLIGNFYYQLSNFESEEIPIEVVEESDDGMYLSIFKKLKQMALKAHIENPTELTKYKVKRDPFLIPGTQTETFSEDIRTTQAGSLVLSGILWDTFSHSAILGNKLVYEGSKYGSYRIKRIQKNKVILESGTKSISLQLRRNSISRL